LPLAQLFRTAGGVAPLLSPSLRGTRPLPRSQGVGSTSPSAEEQRTPLLHQGGEKSATMICFLSPSLRGTRPLLRSQGVGSTSPSAEEQRTPLLHQGGEKSATMICFLSPSLRGTRPLPRSQGVVLSSCRDDVAERFLIFCLTLSGQTCSFSPAPANRISLRIFSAAGAL